LRAKLSANADHKYGSYINKDNNDYVGESVTNVTLVLLWYYSEIRLNYFSGWIL